MAKGKKSFLDYFKLNESSEDDFDDDLFDEEEDDYDDGYYDDDIDDEEDALDDYEAPQQVKAKTSPLKSFKSYSSGRSASADSGRTKTVKPSRSTGSGSKLVPINGRGGSADSEVFVIKPDEFDDAQLIIDHLNRGQIIIINMEELDLPTAQRIADFVGGASYAIDGLFHAISGNIFMATPNGTYVSGDLREELVESSLTNASGAYSGRATY